MGAGPGRCKKCSRGYQQVGSKCLGESSAKRGWSMGEAREGRMHIETVGVKGSLGCREGSHGSHHSDLSLPPPPPPDVDECETVVCPGENEQCENTEGSYRCVCAEGYRQEDGICVKEQVPGKPGGRLDWS